MTQVHGDLPALTIDLSLFTGPTFKCQYYLSLFFLEGNEV